MLVEQAHWQGCPTPMFDGPQPSTRNGSASLQTGIALICRELFSVDCELAFGKAQARRGRRQIREEEL